MADLGRPGWPAVHLRGEIDIATIAPINAEIDELVDDGTIGIDLHVGDVTFFGATGAGLVARLLDAGLAVHLHGVTPHMSKVLDICMLADHEFLELG